jgi:hypothetical protein
MCDYLYALLRPIRSFSLLLVGLALIGTSSILTAQAQTLIPVTTIVHDENSAPNDLYFRSDDFAGGLFQATYVDSCNGNKSCISTWVATTPPGGWRLNLYGQTARASNNRTVCITLSHPVPPSGPSPIPDGCYWQNIEVFSRCWNSNNQEILFPSIPPGTIQGRCSFNFDVGYNRSTYYLKMGPSIPSLGYDTTGTGWATVSCNTVSGTTCNSWTVTPNMNAVSGNVPMVANLYLGAQLLGQYYMTFRIDVTNP